MKGQKKTSRAMTTVRYVLGLLFPAQPYARPLEKIYGGLGALVGILCLTASLPFIAPDVAIPVVASMGASAVLLYAAPHSPLAQPWAFAGGHLISALCGVTSYLLFPNPILAAAVAVASAITLMHFLHCLHPPGGATALFAVIGGAPVHQLGYGYVLVPVALNVAIFLTTALIVNNLLIPKRKYPFIPPKPAEKPAARPAQEVTRADVKTAMREMGQFIDISEEDLEDLTLRANLIAHHRQLLSVTAGDIMKKTVNTCVFGDELDKVFSKMVKDPNSGIAVINRARHVIGIITLHDFLRQVNPAKNASPLERISKLVQRTNSTVSDKPEVAGQIMTANPATVFESDTLNILVNHFKGNKIHHLPVTDQNKRLTGMVTQADVLETLGNINKGSKSRKST